MKDANKTAVIFTNHIRCLEETKEVIKQFYPNNTDYYISTYDEDHGWMTAEEHSEQYELYKQETGRKAYIGLLHSPRLYHPLPDGKFDRLTKYFNFKNSFIGSREHSKAWFTKNFSNLLGEVDYKQLFTFGDAYQKYHGWLKVLETGIKYDKVIFQRCDLVPFKEDYTFLPNTYQNRILYADSFRIFKGYLHFDDRFCFGSYDFWKSFFDRFVEKVNYSVDSPFVQKDKAFFTNHRICSSILLHSNIYKNKKLPFYFKKIRKHNILEPFTIENLKKIDDKDFYGKIPGYNYGVVN